MNNMNKKLFEGLVGSPKGKVSGSNSVALSPAGRRLINKDIPSLPTIKKSVVEISQVSEKPVSNVG